MPTATLGDLPKEYQDNKPEAKGEAGREISSLTETGALETTPSAIEAPAEATYPSGAETLTPTAEMMPSEEGKGQEERGKERREGLRARFYRPKKRPVVPPVAPIVRDQLTTQVEKIMEEGLRDAYRALTSVQQQEFRLKGEETARKIRDLLKSAQVRVKKIFRLILAWLKLLPGVNRFFLEQEAKIKADKIIALKYYKDMTHDS